MSFDVSYAVSILPFLLEGLKYTMLIAVLGLLIGFAIGVLIGISRTTHNRALNAIASFYVEIIRGTPLMVQAIYIYFALPMIFGFNISALAAGIIAISVNSGAYISEIVRGAIQAVPKGQTEAGMVLGMQSIQIMMHITFPQAFRMMIPSLGNQFIISLKDTSILTIIGVGEIMRQGTMLVSASFKPVEIYTAVALIYLLSIMVISRLLKLLEKRMGLL
ncbi:MAG: amino acid ABC transporter permease [Acetanaerobacterium sp.]